MNEWNRRKNWLKAIMMIMMMTDILKIERDKIIVIIISIFVLFFFSQTKIPEDSVQDFFRFVFGFSFENFFENVFFLHHFWCACACVSVNNLLVHIKLEMKCFWIFFSVFHFWHLKTFPISCLIVCLKYFFLLYLSPNRISTLNMWFLIFTRKKIHLVKQPLFFVGFLFDFD